MTEVEAFNWIIDNFSPSSADTEKDEACRTMLFCLNKNIPKALAKTKETLRCPRCKRHITNVGMKKPSIKYCCNCGQALAWEDVRPKSTVDDVGPIEITYTLKGGDYIEF